MQPGAPRTGHGDVFPADHLDDLPLAGDVAARGRQLAPGVTFDTRSPIQVIARVPDLAEHRVRLLLRSDGLDWDCDCEDAKRAPCMHVAAVVIALRQDAAS